MSRKRAKFIIYALILAGAFLLLFTPASTVTPFKFSVIQAVAFPIRVIIFPFKELKKIVLYRKTYNEYRSLKYEVEILRDRLNGADEIVKENNRLAKLLDFKRKLIFSSVSANVVGRDPTNWNSSVVIDRGLEDGVDIGMPVVSALGVVGKVAEVAENKAKVVLLTDPSFAVAGLIKRSREVGLVSGTLQSKCRMRYLSVDSDVQVGDEVMTSKLSSAFPEGLMIGKVMEVFVDSNSLSVLCLIEPAVSLSQLEEVLVIQKR
ncbi:MAG TPA: rod shape-determining protein MreC [Candidatus Omnitrophota bacterium]|nr:rod shape-determining protein MreC [Candidatus Omnitrophota bacterium]HSA30444.1 rod shape-determining protein MreC [Candidatus Omnitrophota bacterium]